jgi:hypothetical protein
VCCFSPAAEAYYDDDHDGFSDNIHHDGFSDNIQSYICNQKFTGWRLDYATRKCTEDTTTGCVDPFPYRSKYECMQDFEGKNYT